MRARPGLLIAGVFLWITIIVQNSASGRSYIVNSPDDSHDILPGDSLCGDHTVPDSCFCTLRAAIEEANAIPGPDTIVIADSISEVLLTLGQIEITDDSVAIFGHDLYPAIDGGLNDMATDIIRLSASHSTIQGLTIRKSRRHGVVIQGSDNLVGGQSETERNIFVGNGLDYTEGYAVVLKGNTATNNHISGNFIGLYGNGTVPYGNDNAVLITDSAYNNTIGYFDHGAGNLISGNTGYGIHISGSSHDNQVSGNTIGPDIVGIDGPGNCAGGVRIDSAAHHNLIGGNSKLERNQISGNGADGIAICGRDTHNNSVSGNLIGLSPDGWNSVSNYGDGVSISDGAHDNIIGGSTDEERNIISGNVGSGLSIIGAGTDRNLVQNNGIGISEWGTWLLDESTRNEDGLVISDGAQYNTIASNILSANVHAGLLIRDAGTSHNKVTGNYIGLNLRGSHWAPNGSGVVIRYGASHNDIGGDQSGEGNVISANVYDAYPFGAGVIIYDAGTSYNYVQGNKIGTNAEGTRGLRNSTAGVMIGYRANHNVIGGDTPAAGNLISGNGNSTYLGSMGRGVHIFGDGTDYNRISNNAIGLTADSTMAISNYGHGIGIFEGARYNIIGGANNGRGNLIVGNEGHGLCIGDTETRYNTVRYNQFYDNDSLNIVLLPGTQGEILPPRLLEATPHSISGSDAPPGATVDIYLVVRDSAVYDRGVRAIASGTAQSDGTFAFSLDEQPGLRDSVSATVTDVSGNSSALAATVAITTPTSVSDSARYLPSSFSLGQNYPNPLNPSTVVPFTLPIGCNVTLRIYNITGQLVSEVSGLYPAGSHEIALDGSILSSGVYFYRLDAGDFTDTRKMVLLK